MWCIGEPSSRFEIMPAADASGVRNLQVCKMRVKGRRASTSGAIKAIDILEYSRVVLIDDDEIENS
jgi:hypothetical protein